MINRNIDKICKDFAKIENYEKAVADNSKWECHHRLETHFSDGTLRPKNCYLTAKELKALDMYFDRPAEELIFLSKSEHCALHTKSRDSGMKGKHHSEESKQKSSKAHKGQHFSEEQRLHMSIAAKKRGITPETRAKITTALKGKKLSEETKQKMSLAQKGEKNNFYGKKHTEEAKRKMSEAAKARYAKKRAESE